MTKISAKVIADSKNEFGNRITTMIVTFPRFILAELNTHRMMSRNSASSRAIPFEKMLDAVENNPFIPMAWQKDHKGMQGSEYFTNRLDIKVCESLWLAARDSAIDIAKRLGGINTDAEAVTKQLCNRLLEPFMWHTVIVTATEWENFFALRCPRYKLTDGLLNNNRTHRSRKDAIKAAKLMEIFPRIDEWKDLDWLRINDGQAEIHMMELAEQMWDVINESIPKELKAGEWHVPFGDYTQVEDIQIYDLSVGIKEVRGAIDRYNHINELKIKIATAMCARVSYTVVGEENKPTNYENDIKLHDRLAESGHWSPFEHCAQAMSEQERNNSRLIFWNEQKGDLEIELGVSGNFIGFKQYRKTFQNENITG